MIKDYLSAYYKAHGENLIYKAVQSFIVDGHEVAWMKYTGKVVLDTTGEGGEGEPFYGHVLQCECDFKEGVGWYIDDDGNLSSILLEDEAGTLYPGNCPARKKVLAQRHSRLRLEYIQRFLKRGKGKPQTLALYISDIIFDLIQKAKANEFLEDGEGAPLYGGHFYVSTLASITRVDISYIWTEVERLLKEEKISLEGNIICDYKGTTPKPTWRESFRITQDGWMGIAFTPSNLLWSGKNWKLEVVNPEGKVVLEDISLLAFKHNPEYPDFDNALHIVHKEKAKQKLKKLIRKAKKKKT